MKLAPYPEYKDSGVEWLGQVPKHWEVKKLRYLCNIETGSCDTINADAEAIYPFYVRSQEVEKIDTWSYDCEAILTAGDGVGVGKVFHHHLGGKFDFHQRVYMLHYFSGIKSRYLFYYISRNFALVALDGGAKSTVDSLRRPMFTNFQVTLPPLPEQTAIAAYLDAATAKIDALMREQDEMIALLKEKRQALISHCVTKGLNPAAPLKDSGIEWLGMVPEHWAIAPIKRFCQKVTDGAHISPDTNNGVEFFVSTKDISGKGIDFDNCLKTSSETYEYMVKTGCQPKINDVLFSKDGTIGRTLIVECEEKFVVASSLIIISCELKLLSPYFLSALCQSKSVLTQVESLVKGAGLPRLSIQNLLKIICCVPSLPEQTAIAAFLDAETAKIDALMAEAEGMIERMREHRSSLISHVVTGKVRVMEETP